VSSDAASAKLTRWCNWHTFTWLAVIGLVIAFWLRGSFSAGGDVKSNKEAFANSTNEEIPSYPAVVTLGYYQTQADSRLDQVKLCQFSSHEICGVDCRDGKCEYFGWSAKRPIRFDVFGQGEYVGPARLAHVPEYRLRVDDQVEFLYRFPLVRTHSAYVLDVGDEVMIESETDSALNRGNLDRGRGLRIESDGHITVRIIGQVRAAGRTVQQLRDVLNKKYAKFHRLPAITVTPIKTNSKLESLRATVDGRAGRGGQRFTDRVGPDGMVQLPGIDSVFGQGLTLKELKHEIAARYRDVVLGVEVTPRLVARAPRYVFVTGEVARPGRIVMQGPTTVIQAMTMAGHYTVGANISQVVILRRTEDWRLIATKVNLRSALLGHDPCPEGEIFLRDSDIVIVPKGAILWTDDLINLVFTRGIYGVLPNQGISLNFTKASTL
jgi:polysaccharide export outer membrane protein